MMSNVVDWGEMRSDKVGKGRLGWNDVKYTMSRCPGGDQDFHWVHPIEQNVCRDVPYYPEENDSG